MRAFLLPLVLLTWVMVAQTPPKSIETSEHEKVVIRAAQVEILGLLQQRTQLKAQFDAQDADLVKQIQAAQPALDKALADVRAAHKCADCGFDKELNLTPAPKPPAAGPAPK